MMVKSKTKKQTLDKTIDTHTKHIHRHTYTYREIMKLLYNRFVDINRAKREGKIAREREREGKLYESNKLKTLWNDNVKQSKNDCSIRGVHGS